jgi:CubicO group peptidase (beta-lactamase class C family)
VRLPALPYRRGPRRRRHPRRGGAERLRVRCTGTALLFAGAAAACLIGAPAAAQAPAFPADPRVDGIFGQWDRPGSPGCALGVVRDGALVYARGYGYANLDYDIPITPEMVFYVGSVSKQFTAAAIALLVHDGRISLDDDVRRWIPELPSYDRAITIRHLVHHTSGLRDIYGLMSLAGLRLEDVFPDDEALRLIAAQRALNFPPGDDFLYSNSGYFLLAEIVERVTGRSFRAFTDAAIFRPLGMSDTHFHDSPSEVVKNRVVSYAPDDAGGFRISYLANFDKVGAGGLYTTIGDLAKWDANFYDPRVGGEDLLERIHTRGMLTSGDTLSYAFGLTIGSHRGLRTIRHSGSMMGFKAELLRFPDARFTVATLCNLGTIDPAALSERVAEVHLGDRMTPIPVTAGGDAEGGRSRDEPRPAAFAAADYVGAYHSEELAAVYRIESRSEGLVLVRPLGEPVGLRPTARPDSFTAGDLRLRFARAADGRVTAFTVEAGRVRNIRFVRD